MVRAAERRRPFAVGWFARLSVELSRLPSDVSQFTDAAIQMEKWDNALHHLGEQIKAAISGSEAEGLILTKRGGILLKIGKAQEAIEDATRAIEVR
eukprot:5278982-Pyramimonas_sp.AAC.1